MKKIIGIMVCCILCGCSSSQKKRPVEVKLVRALDQEGMNFFHQTIAPWPWITVLLSDDALAMKDVDSNIISHVIHYDLNFHKEPAKAKEIRLILLDYKIKQPSNSSLKNETLKVNGITYDRKAEDTHPEYVMKISIYKGKNKPPAIPDFEETVKLDARKATPFEAMKFLAHEIMMDYMLTKSKKIEVSLD
ncbi:MAG: hypothetical protein JSR85_02525 [Proteobacteria bacterium]|nr:hypothetical protein [Pseudomonadota bacterium]